MILTFREEQSLGNRSDATVPNIVGCKFNFIYSLLVSHCNEMHQLITFQPVVLTVMHRQLCEILWDSLK